MVRIDVAAACAGFIVAAITVGWWTATTVLWLGDAPGMPAWATAAYVCLVAYVPPALALNTVYQLATWISVRSLVPIMSDRLCMNRFRRGASFALLNCLNASVLIAVGLARAESLPPHENADLRHALAAGYWALVCTAGATLLAGLVDALDARWH